VCVCGWLRGIMQPWCVVMLVGCYHYVCIGSCLFITWVVIFVKLV